jgi:hypothetical protein
MGQFIVKLEGRYLIWSGIVDAPITMGMTLEQLTEYVREESGRVGLERLPGRLERVERTGTSAMNHGNVIDTVWLNRAGARESCMTLEQLIDYYVRNGDTGKPLPVGKNEPPKYPREKA